MFSKELVDKFNEAKSGNSEATFSVINYFMNNIERQLSNLNLEKEVKADKSIKCYEMIIQNLNLYYNFNEFFTNTMESIKRIIYLNQVETINNSRTIIANQDFLNGKISLEDISNLQMPVKIREIARLYFIENKSIEEISEITKDNKTIICVRLNRVLRAIKGEKVSNYTHEDQSFIYNK